MAQDKTTFMQNNIIRALAMTESDKENRFDKALAMCEKAWDKLAEAGYSPKRPKDPQTHRDWYAELSKEAREAFNKARTKYGKQYGTRQDAAKAWLKVDPRYYDKIIWAIPKYLEARRCDGIAICHFSTWLNGERWEGFDKPEEKRAQSDTRSDIHQDIIGLTRVLDMTKDTKTRADIEKQIEGKRREAQRIYESKTGR